LLKSKYWKVVKGLPVFLHSALVYSREKILPWKVNLGRDPGAEEDILEGSKRIACFFYILLRYIQEKFGWVCFCVAILVF